MSVFRRTVYTNVNDLKSSFKDENESKKILWLSILIIAKKHTGLIKNT